MPTQTFIKFDGVDGESTHKDHKGEVEVLSWDWGLTAAPGLSGGGGGGSGGGGGGVGAASGKSTPKELRLVHRYDKASPVLAKHAAAGKHIPLAVLSARKTGSGQKVFLKVTMKDVFITSVAVSAAAPDADPIEEMALSYSAIEFAYSPQSSSGGVGAPVGFKWDIKTGKVT